MIAISDLRPAGGDPGVLEASVEVTAPIVFDVGFCVEWWSSDPGARASLDSRAAGLHLGWLPRGRWQLRAPWPAVADAAAEGMVVVRASHRCAGAIVDGASATLRAAAPVWPVPDSGTRFALRAAAGTPALESLSWHRGAGWAFAHFDHAAAVIGDYMLRGDPALRGRILDVGCGDGLTDLGLALRWRPRELVGVDLGGDWVRLPQLLPALPLPDDAIPPTLRFLRADANALPFADDDFDVVVSWSALEHITGGYRGALAEIRRVLRPGGLLFVQPALYHSQSGSHLDDYPFMQAEPYQHLTRPRDWLRGRVLASPVPPRDLGGQTPTPAQRWQWFEELNRITVAGFEADLRALGFEPRRVALRAHDHVDYTPRLQTYSFVDLLVGELYVACVNRK